MSRKQQLGAAAQPDAAASGGAPPPLELGTACTAQMMYTFTPAFLQHRGPTLLACTERSGRSSWSPVPGATVCSLAMLGSMKAPMRVPLGRQAPPVGPARCGQVLEDCQQPSRPGIARPGPYRSLIATLSRRQPHLRRETRVGALRGRAGPGVRGPPPVRIAAPRSPSPMIASMGTLDSSDAECPVFIDRNGEMIEVMCCDYVRRRVWGFGGGGVRTQRTRVAHTASSLRTCLGRANSRCCIAPFHPQGMRSGVQRMYSKGGAQIPVSAWKLAWANFAQVTLRQIGAAASVVRSATARRLLRMCSCDAKVECGMLTQRCTLRRSGRRCAAPSAMENMVKSQNATRRRAPLAR